ncbi:phosphohistidine phosphatase SixA [Gilliamella sp. Fer2-1]|nr:phosphohistidine phosphatase SixA [Gilliamella apicola]OCG26829.1 phosphohistidine phosphatase SixA [Gilliamella apicola]OCG29421.1 phosphohistidine phosphatase SixA [Gilliamella apicola]OCG40793.1 phosphohistidine phosphatase SixA [Gilliamella apicola]
MKVCIMRHGEAGFSASSDFSRALTNYGIKQSNQAGMWLKEQGYQFELGLVSPYLRAQQTFTALSSHVNVAKIETDQFLVPGGNSSHAAGILTMLLAEGTENVIVVSHLPLVGYLVNELCPQINPPMFPTAAIACINLSLDSAGKLEWFYQAE